MFEKRDFEQFRLIGIDAEAVEIQIKLINNGFPFLNIISPASINRGIIILDNDERDRYIEKFKTSSSEISRFVPASGAATRMFKDLYEALDDVNKGGEIDNNSNAGQFFLNLNYFPFYNDLKGISGFDPNNKSSVLELLLTKKGLNYGSLPKGLLKFHNYSDHSRTAFEEQLVESVKYATSYDGIAKMVFTVSEEHLDSFTSFYSSLYNKFKNDKGTILDVKFTLQKRSTDTVAVGMDGQPFRNPDGSILFRPGGHGALLNNLQESDSDIVFIKNIDNVTKEEYLSDTVIWKQTLAGILLQIRDEIFSFLKRLDGESDPALNDEIIKFLNERLCIKLPDLPGEIRKDFLYAKLNRPIRVCGMVRNEGEPGGGPYIVMDADGSTSLQILESAQLDKSNRNYQSWMNESTHFNPVDLVCSIRDYQGKKFDLSKYVDPETGFISNKSIQGQSIKALELPGLWNGAMSNWNTIFVEVPVSTFNPVKSVTDLLRPQHSGFSY